jgi:hypothetical protein
MSQRTGAVSPSPQARPAAVACTLPTLLGTAGLAALAHVSSIDAGTALILFLLAYAAAAWGPALIPLGILAALLDRRRRGRHDAFSWTALGAAVVAALTAYGWLLPAIELP